MRHATPGNHPLDIAKAVAKLAGLDPGTAAAVAALRSRGVETYESCQGGPGHVYPEPTVRFHGHFSEGFRALAVALDCALPVRDLRRVWSMTLGEPVGPTWEMTFYRRLP